MTIKELQDILQNSGIAGVGGAGFPAYAKLSDKTETILLNCAECEPLLKLHRQVLKKYAEEILMVLTLIADTLNAGEILIGIKEAYVDTIKAVEAQLSSFPKVKIKLLKEVYPAGDEVVLIYETTKKALKPGQLPIEEGIIVYNVETMLNAYRAIYQGKPVTEKYVTIAGEVKQPITVKVPIGITVSQLIEKAGGITTEKPAFIMGGPMTGNIVTEADIVTKTTNGIIVLSQDHYVIKKKTGNVSIDLKRAMSTCCQCEMCTDLCPRNLLGHPIAPHAFMRSATSGITKELSPFLDTFYCCSCGLCEMYSCMQDLSPRTLIMNCKQGLAKNGVRPSKKEEQVQVNPKREYRTVPMDRLKARIDLERYDVPAPLTKTSKDTKKVKIMLSQHIGAPAKPCVKKGDKVSVGMIIGKAEEGQLSIPVHASINGIVTDIRNNCICLEKEAVQ